MDIPFQELKTREDTDWYLKNNIKSKDFVLELVDYISGLNVKDATTPEGKISGKLFKELNFNTEWEKGLLEFILTEKRGYISHDLFRNVFLCTLVPFIPCCFKHKYGTPYNNWIDIEYIVHGNLAEAMQHKEVNPGSLDYWTRVYGLDLEELEGIVMDALTTDTGKFRITNRYITNFSGFSNNLVGIMATQLWAARPCNRTAYMVLDPLDWDYMPYAGIEPEETPMHEVTLARGLELLKPKEQKNVWAVSKKEEKAHSVWDDPHNIWGP